ncbi:SPFH domain-containing protein [Streptomyces luomodiensis]|uniref:SPFH domain-containing protein n=1 Tax=Streptomyces luomodiensis TaxID=3026192 RepID=A0ABY9UMW0_9ACTN|nr:SPFH domain-containing protein [Streptomyces sp. SCA4-21]WNE93874.1 SPFH domain-containing protein [Streptomyces sp. SCA4-21]
MQVIPEASAAVVELFGKYDRTIYPGLRWLTPFMHTVRNRIDLRGQTVPFPLRLVSTKDGQEVPVQVTVQYHITDPQAATYAVASYIHALEQRMLFELINSIALLEATHTRTQMRELSAQIENDLRAAVKPWGITVDWFGTLPGTESDSKDAPRVLVSSLVMGDQVVADTYSRGNNHYSNEGSGSQYHVDRSNHVVAGSSHSGAGEQVTLNNAVLDTTALVQWAQLVRQVAPTLGAPPEQEQEIIQDAEVLEGEASVTSTEPGRLRALYDRIQGSLSAVTSLTAGLTLLIQQGEQAAHAVLGN